MARPAPLSLLLYAINGRGLGHLTRLLAIARAARELCDALEIATDFQFVTTSEACSIVDDFPVYKLPSKTAVGRHAAVRDRHLQHAKLIVSNLVAAVNPHVLVLDTVPYGAFQELAFLRSYARSTAYVYRHMDEAVARSELVQRHLELFDRIIVPDVADRAEAYPVPRAARDRVAFVGAVHGFSEARAWPRERVRDHFGVGRGRRLIYVAAGGGGDDRRGIEHLVRAVAADPRNFVLAGYGPLHRGECIHGENIAPLLQGNVSRFFSGLDAAISAAGYNSYEELLAARVPALFFSQHKGLDRQDGRVARGLEQAWHGALATGFVDVCEIDPHLVRGRLDDLLTGAMGERVRAALALRAASRGALGAAVALLSVAAALPESGIDRSALFEVAAWRSRAAPEHAADFAVNVRAYRAWRALAATPTELALGRDEHAAYWWQKSAENAEHDGGGHGRRLDETLAAGSELVASKSRLGLGDEVWHALLKSFAAEAALRSEREKRARLLDALRALGPEHGTLLEKLAQTESRPSLACAVTRLLEESEARSLLREDHRPANGSQH